MAGGFKETVHPSHLLDVLPKLFRDRYQGGTLLKPACLLPQVD